MLYYGKKIRALRDKKKYSNKKPYIHTILCQHQIACVDPI